MRLRRTDGSLKNIVVSFNELGDLQVGEAWWALARTYRWLPRKHRRFLQRVGGSTSRWSVV